MNLPPSAFATTFRALAVPKLTLACEFHGLLVALGLETVPEAKAEVMAEAWKHRAQWLTPEHFALLEDWIFDTMLAEATKKATQIDARNKSLAHVTADIEAWGDAVHKAAILG